MSNTQMDQQQPPLRGMPHLQHIIEVMESNCETVNNTTERNNIEFARKFRFAEYKPMTAGQMIIFKNPELIISMKYEVPIDVPNGIITFAPLDSGQAYPRCGLLEYITEIEVRKSCYSTVETSELPTDDSAKFDTKNHVPLPSETPDSVDLEIIYGGKNADIQMNDIQLQDLQSEPQSLNPKNISQSVKSVAQAKAANSQKIVDAKAANPIKIVDAKAKAANSINTEHAKAANPSPTVKMKVLKSKFLVFDEYTNKSTQTTTHMACTSHVTMANNGLLRIPYSIDEVPETKGKETEYITKKLAVIAYKKNNETQYKTIMFDSILKHDTAAKQYKELCGFLNRQGDVFDAIDGKKGGMDLYIKYFIKPQMQFPTETLKHCYTNGICSHENRLYYCCDTAIMRVDGHKGLLMQRIGQDQFIQSFEESRIYWDEQMYKVKSVKFNPEETLHFSKLQFLKRVPRQFNQHLIESFGTKYTFRLLLVLATIALSLFHVEDIVKDCGTLISFLFIGEQNLGKSRILVQAMKFMGLLNNLTSSNKTKNTTKAGFRQLQALHECIMLILEDCHTGENTLRTDRKDWIMHFSGTDPEMVASSKETGKSTQIVICTANAEILKPTHFVGEALTRQIVMPWKASDISEKCSTDEMANRRVLLTTFFPRLQFQFLCAAKKFDSVEFEIMTHECKQKHRKLAEEYQQSWFKDKRLYKFDARMMTMIHTLCTEFLYLPDVVAKQMQTLYKTNVITRYVKYVADQMNQIPAYKTTRTLKGNWQFYAQQIYLLYYLSMYESDRIRNKFKDSRGIGFVHRPQDREKMITFGKSAKEILSSFKLMHSLISRDVLKQGPYKIYSAFVGSINTIDEVKEMCQILHAGGILKSYAKSARETNVNMYMFTNNSRKIFGIFFKRIDTAANIANKIVSQNKIKYEPYGDETWDDLDNDEDDELSYPSLQDVLHSQPSATNSSTNVTAANNSNKQNIHQFEWSYKVGDYVRCKCPTSNTTETAQVKSRQIQNHIKNYEIKFLQQLCTIFVLENQLTGFVTEESSKEKPKDCKAAQTTSSGAHLSKKRSYSSINNTSALNIQPFKRQKINIQLNKQNTCTTSSQQISGKKRNIPQSITTLSQPPMKKAQKKFTIRFPAKKTLKSKKKTQLTSNVHENKQTKSKINVHQNITTKSESDTNFNDKAIVSSTHTSNTLTSIAAQNTIKTSKSDINSNSKTEQMAKEK